MRWTVFVIAALLAVAADTSLLRILAIGDVHPQLTPVVAVFVALSAPRLIVMWAGLALGALVDLTTPLADAVGGVHHLLGPHALGYLFAVNVVLPLRTMVIRRNPLTMGVLAATFAFSCALVVVAVMVIRSWYGEPLTVFDGGAAPRELFRSALQALYTGGLAVPAGWLLNRTSALWGFQQVTQRLRW
jgi:hypothetical protein